MPRKIQRYGWRHDAPDFRDHLYSDHAPAALGLPSSVDLRTQCPPVYDQGELGSCTANAIGFAYEFDLKKQSKPNFMPSRLFIYYGERLMENTVDQDAGAEIRDGMKVISTTGVAEERFWPYVITKFAKKPTKPAYQNATLHKAIQYLSVAQTEEEIKTCLSEGFPVVFGFTVYAPFEDEAVASTGMLPMPLPTDELVGGHAVAIVGYDDSKKCFLVRNSWGVEWGIGGYFWMPYAYATDANLASDFWTVRTISG
jgi:C1A family cysteine protease